MRFREFILKEEPLGAAPGGMDMGGAPPPGGPMGAPGGPMPPPGGPMGGGAPPMGGPPMGGPMGGPPPGGPAGATGGPPIKPKSFDVWSVLEELLDKKKKVPSQPAQNMVKPQSLNQ